MAAIVVFMLLVTLPRGTETHVCKSGVAWQASKEVKEVWDTRIFAAGLASSLLVDHAIRPCLDTMFFFSPFGTDLLRSFFEAR